MRFLKIILVLLLTATNAWATDPQGLISYPPNKIMGYRGLDTRSTPPTIADSRAQDLFNVKLSAALDLKKRSGYSVINGTLDDFDLDSEPITGLFDSVYSNGNTWVYAFIGNKLKYDDSAQWTGVTGAVTITSGTNNQWQCRMALDNSICTNDVDVPIKIDATPSASALDTSDLSASLDKAKTLIWFRNYLIFGNTVENSVERPTRFRWSNVGTIETYSDNDFVDISTFGGDEIIGFAELYGDLYIFLTKSIWRASLVGGDEIFVFKKVVDGIGAVARDSIEVVTLNDNRVVTIFLDEQKRVLMYNGASVSDIGGIIQTNLDLLNDSRLGNAVATFDGESYFLSASQSASTENDIIYEFQTQIFEWTRHDQIDANAFAQVKESDLDIVTYFGNYDGFVYWLDNPDKNADVLGASGILESVGIVDTATQTGAQILIDNEIVEGAYTGAIVRITSGTSAGNESVVLSATDTGIIVTDTFSTTPDSTSVYTVGNFNSYYYTKHYSFGDDAREKNAFLGMLLWGKEASGNSVDVAYTIDFQSEIGTVNVDLSSIGSIWDEAIWDFDVWSATGDNIFTVKTNGLGNHIQYRFKNDTVNESFHLYGFNLLATGGDIKVP